MIGSMEAAAGARWRPGPVHAGQVPRLCRHGLPKLPISHTASRPIARYPQSTPAAGPGPSGSASGDVSESLAPIVFRFTDAPSSPAGTGSGAGSSVPRPVVVIGASGGGVGGGSGAGGGLSPPVTVASSASVAPLEAPPRTVVGNGGSSSSSTGGGSSTGTAAPGPSRLSHVPDSVSSSAAPLTHASQASTSYSDHYRKANTPYQASGPAVENSTLKVSISTPSGLANGWTHVVSPAGATPDVSPAANAVDSGSRGGGGRSGSESAGEEAPSDAAAPPALDGSSPVSAAAHPSPSPVPVPEPTTAAAITADGPTTVLAPPDAPATAAASTDAAAIAGAASNAAGHPEVNAAMARVHVALERAVTSLEDMERLSSSYDAAALASLAAAAGPPSRLSRFLSFARGAATFGALSFAMLASHAFGLAVQWAGAVAGAALMAVWSLRRGALAPSGAAAAFLVGAGTLGSSLRFGATLIAFFLSSSKLTAYKEELKEGLEEGAKKGGQRSWIQVFCNGLVPTVLAVIYGILAGCVDLPLGPPAASAAAADAAATVAAAAASAAADAAADAVASAAPAAAATVAAAVGPALEPWRAAALTGLMGGFLGYYACCCGDTWASELGPLSRDTPRLITTMQPVRRGTNGGVTLLGLSASIMGGMFVGLVFYLAGLLSPTLWIFEAQRSLAASQWRLIPLGLMAGLLGSVLDSLLGATLQFSGYDPATGRIVGRPGPGVMRIAGRHILDNNAVNAVSASATAGLTALMALKTFGF